MKRRKEFAVVGVGEKTKVFAVIGGTRNTTEFAVVGVTKRECTSRVSKKVGHMWAST